jgi:hypothetical protein
LKSIGDVWVACGQLAEKVPRLAGCEVLTKMNVAPA